MDTVTRFTLYLCPHCGELVIRWNDRPDTHPAACGAVR